MNTQAQAAHEPPVLHSASQPSIGSAKEGDEGGSPVQTLDFRPPVPGSASDEGAETPDAKPPHRKIAKLPKVLQDRINSMLDDCLPARQIIANLQTSTDPALPYPISEMNISAWRNTGYQRYLAQKERLATVQANREAAQEMVATDDTTTLPEATLQIIASQYFEFLGDFSPESLKQKLAEDPLKYTRFLSVFARLTREIVNLKKYRAAATSAVALKRLDPNRKINAAEEMAMHDKSDDFFGWKSADRIRRELASQVSTDSTPSPTEPGKSEPDCRRRGQPSVVLSTKEGDESLINEQPQPEGLKEDSRGSKSAETPGEIPADSSHPAGMPDAPDRAPSPARSTPPAPATTNGNDAFPRVSDSAPNPLIQSPEPPREECHYCRKELPPLLPNGQRVSTHCQKCGTALRPPETRHFYCPRCHGRLHNIFADNRRTSDHCPHCAAALPPVPPPPEPVEEGVLSSSSSSSSSSS